MTQDNPYSGGPSSPIGSDQGTFDATAMSQQAQLKSKQNLILAIVGGSVAAIVAAAIWATVTVVTEYQIGWMAVGVGFAVGFAVRALGKGVTPIYGIIGGLLALFACLLGNLLSTCGFIAQEFDISFFEALGNCLSNPGLAVDLMKETFHPMDLLFYGIAVYGGNKAAYTEVN